MYDSSLSYLGFDGRPTYNEVAIRAGVDRGNLQEQVQKARVTGEPLSKRLEAAAFDALCAIHEEFPLHTYPRFVMTNLSVMRECETKALTRFRSAAEHWAEDDQKSKEDRVKALKEAFETAARNVTDPFSPWVVDALGLLEQDHLFTDKDLGTLYIGAAALQTVVELWEDAASVITKLQPNQSDEATVNFEYMNIEGLTTVLDVLGKSLDLYEELDAALLGRARSAEERKLTLLQQDRQIVSIHLAELCSHALDWLRATPELLSRIGLPTELILTTVQAFSRRAPPAALTNSAALLERFSHNLVLARNVIYMARQLGVEGSEIEKKASDHVATLLNITAGEVYSSTWLSGRKPLLDEPPFKTVNVS